jgi:hypothetical protein
MQLEERQPLVVLLTDPSMSMKATSFQIVMKACWKGKWGGGGMTDVKDISLGKKEKCADRTGATYVLPLSDLKMLRLTARYSKYQYNVFNLKKNQFSLLTTVNET